MKRIFRTTRWIVLFALAAGPLVGCRSKEEVQRQERAMEFLGYVEEGYHPAIVGTYLAWRDEGARKFDDGRVVSVASVSLQPDKSLLMEGFRCVTVTEGVGEDGVTPQIEEVIVTAKTARVRVNGDRLEFNLAETEMRTFVNGQEQGSGHEGFSDVSIPLPKLDTHE